MTIAQPHPDHLVFFARGARAAAALDTEADFDSDELVDVAFWRWTSPPTLIGTARAGIPDVTYIEWTDDAFGGSGGFAPDVKAVQGELDCIISEDGLDLWDVVSVASEAGAVDGYVLGPAEASKASVALAAPDWDA